MKERPGYKQTFLDRHGPDGVLRIRVFGYGPAATHARAAIANLEAELLADQRSS